jgi:succinoglycan biosynthesis transport protein ExoP
MTEPADAEDTLVTLPSQPSATSGTPDSHDFFRALRRKRWVIILCTLLVPLAAVGVALLQDERWKASASLLFRDPQFAQQLFGSSLDSSSSDPQREAATNLELVSLEVVADRAARKIGRVTGKELLEQVEISSKSQSDVVTIEATDENPRRAARIANVLATEYVAFRREADQQKVRSAQALVQRKLDALPPEDRDGPLGDTLRDRTSELDVLASLQTGNAEVVQPAAVPRDPALPRPKLNAAVGAVLGILLGAGLALLLDRLDRRMRDPEEVEAILQRPILSRVPISRALSRQEPHDLPAPVSEAFRMLRANLRYFNVDREIRTVLTTSASPSEGKSTVALGLAVAAASAGTRTLLLDLDLRRPTLAKRLGIEGQGGVSLALAAGVPLHEVVHEVSLGGGSERAGPHLHFAPAGPPPPNPTDLIESRRMDDLFREAEENYDLVVVDTPPTSLISDAIPLIRKVTGVLIVSRLGLSTRDEARRLRDQLQHLDAPVLGIVINGTRHSEAYYYGYVPEPAADLTLGERPQRAAASR